MTTYEPGTVAIATVRGVPGVRIFYTGDIWTASAPVKGGFLATPDEIRPLVVLDLPRPAGFLAALDQAISAAPDAHMTPLLSLHEQIEQQIRPPKPPEPKGWGAVVEDRTGAYWTLIAPEAGVFANYREGHRLYADIDANRVVGEGVDA